MIRDKHPGSATLFCSKIVFLLGGYHEGSLVHLLTSQLLKFPHFLKIILTIRPEQDWRRHLSFT
jgi:hypothetical protein